MKLTELNPEWLSNGGEGVTDGQGNSVEYREKVGISFDCPCGCKRPCTIIFSNPIDGKGPIKSSTYWTRTNETFENLSLSPSIKRIIPDCWHGYITNGEVIFCADSKKG